jgi:uracil-DNA glycosylase
MNIKTCLIEIITRSGISPENLLLPDAELDPNKISVVMINEVPPQNPDDWFYSAAENPDYMKTTLDLFARAGIAVESIGDIISRGIYITTAVKSPKTGYTVDTEIIKAHLPLLQAELDLFPNLKVVMLMGDVAKKAVNMIAKAQTKKNVIPAESTYKIRQNEYYWGKVRVLPSYIMTGKSLLIEKGKCDMIADDIKRMADAAKIAFADMRTAFVGEAERLGLKDERDVVALVDEVREEMWKERYAGND